MEDETFEDQGQLFGGGGEGKGVELDTPTRNQTVGRCVDQVPACWTVERFRKGIGLYGEKKEMQGGENDLRETVVKGVAAVAVGGTLLSMRRLAGGPPEMGEIGGALLAGGLMVLVNQVRSVGI